MISYIGWYKLFTCRSKNWHKAGKPHNYVRVIFSYISMFNCTYPIDFCTSGICNSIHIIGAKLKILTKWKYLEFHVKKIITFTVLCKRYGSSSRLSKRTICDPVHLTFWFYFAATRQMSITWSCTCYIRTVFPARIIRSANTITPTKMIYV